MPPTAAHTADIQRAAQNAAPKLSGYSREDVVANLSFFFGDPVVSHAHTHTHTHTHTLTHA